MCRMLSGSPLARMNILFCKNHFAGLISGADEIALTYAIELIAAGHATSILLMQPASKNDPLAARLRAADVPLDSLASTAFSTSLATARWFDNDRRRPSHPWVNDGTTNH